VKAFVKPLLQILEVRLEERIAACDTNPIEIGEWVPNGNNPNRNRPPDGTNNCWTWSSEISYTANES